MLEAISWKKASDGTAGVDMQVALVTEWKKVGIGGLVSFQNAWTGTSGGATAPTGTFSLQFTNIAVPAYNSSAADYPAAAMVVVPSQPAGAAGNNMICVESIGLWAREYYTPSAAGALILPTGNVCFDRIQE